MGGGYFYFTTIIGNDEVVKKIQCTKEYDADEVNAVVDVNNIYNFIGNDKLQKVDSIITYKFKDQNAYETFINNGSIYNYMPEFTINHVPNSDKLTIEYIVEIQVDASYSEPTEYEELINHYKQNEYNCSEKVEK